MRVIKKITLENKLTKFIEKVDWTPLSICCSRFNGDILMGNKTKTEGKVTRYNDTGAEIQSIQRDNQEQEIYKYPHYITENVNGDICTSDYGKKAVVVVDKSGQHRFTYKGQESKFEPYGICTDILGYILFLCVILEVIPFMCWIRMASLCLYSSHHYTELNSPGACV